MEFGLPQLPVKKLAAFEAALDEEEEEEQDYVQAAKRPRTARTRVSLPSRPP